MSKQDEAGLILKLYELRREEVMRKARDWYFREFNPQSMEEFSAIVFGERSAYARMVITYWDMAAALVNSGAISLELFDETNGEHFGVFSKIELLLSDIRAMFGPNFAKNLEALIDATPGGRERSALQRERMKQMRQRFAQQQARA